MVYLPLESYGMIGNMRTAGMVGINGSIDWYCFPYFDSPSIFGALLDDKKGGRFQIAPIEGPTKHKQFYWPSTNILVTRFSLPDGIAELEDFMPVGLPESSPWLHHLYRRIRCVRGKLHFSIQCRPAFNYGRADHNIFLHKNGATFTSNKLSMTLLSSIPLRTTEDRGAVGEFILEEGNSTVFILKQADQEESIECPQCAPAEKEAEELFQTTVRFWQRWLSSCTYRGRWREQVQRSALALKLLTFEPTGAIVASPTCSLPETIGGPRNWDYRYVWVRDAAFTVYAFLRIGFKQEAAAFMQFLKKFYSTYHNGTTASPIIYTIHGEIDIIEETLDHWEGYRESRPVRIGNAAVNQFQNDIYGEVMDSLYLCNKYVSLIPHDTWIKVRDRLNWICDNWQRPDEGIWEMRNRRENFVYSKIMNWVALDRGLRLADKRSFPANRERWTRERDRIYEEVMSKGWNEKRQAFTQFYGSENLDASLLIMPLVFFLAPSDPRMLDTIQAILESPKRGGLVSDGLVYRYPPQSHIDGLPGEEGTFNICTFWLVEALTRAGQVLPEKLDQARLLFERMLGYANHLGLYSEQIGLEGEALGNFPQAFTHLALISAAFNLDRTLGNKP